MWKWLISLVLLICISFFKAPFFLLLAVGWLLILIFSYSKNYYLKGRILTEFVASVEQSRGAILQHFIQVTNTSLYPVSNGQLRLQITNARTGNRALYTIPFAVAAKSSTTVDFTLQLKEIGSLQLQIIEIEIDAFVHFKEIVETDVTINVLPKLYDTLFLAQNILYKSPSESFEKLTLASQQTNEKFGIRPYKQGDSIRQIHWKISTKFDDLYVQENYKAQQLNIVYTIDYAKMDEQEEAQLIEIFLACLKVADNEAKFWLNGQLFELAEISLKKIQQMFMEVVEYPILPTLNATTICITNKKQYDASIIAIQLGDEKVNSLSIRKNQFTKDLYQLGEAFDERLYN